jgi:hypothetical protein
MNQPNEGTTRRASHVTDRRQSAQGVILVARFSTTKQQHHHQHATAAAETQTQTILHQQ